MLEGCLPSTFISEAARDRHAKGWRVLRAPKSAMPGIFRSWPGLGARTEYGRKLRTAA